MAKNPKNSKKQALTGKTEIDPLFYIPEGVEEIRYLPEGSGDANFEELSVDGFEYAFDDADDENESPVGNESSDGAGPDVPGINRIISQTIRRLPSGQQRIDVVLDIDKIPGMTKYEARVSKA